MGDIVLTFACLLAAFWLKFVSGWIQFGVIDAGVTLRGYAGPIVVGAASLILLLATRGAYESDSLHSLSIGLTRVASTVLWWWGLFLGLSLMLKLEPPISRMFVSLAALFAAIALCTLRLGLRLWVRRSLRDASWRQRAIFVGFNSSVAELIGGMQDNRLPGLIPQAIFAEAVDDRWRSLHRGSAADALTVLDQTEAECVFAVDGALSQDQTIALANLCERRYLPFRLVPSSFQILLSGLRLEMPCGIPVLATHELPINRPINRLLKRCADVLGALVGLCLASPVVAVCTLLIRHESPGRVLYAQRRVGRNGVPFTMYKLRTMRLDAEQAGPGWTTESDPRRLRIGAFLRRWNLDEIPQFWNVLRGDMSLVGPRPERPEWITGFETSIPHYNARHTCKPGMTGWAQIHGLRGDTDIAERVRYDLYYLENWSLQLDAYVLFATLFRRQNAY